MSPAPAGAERGSNFFLGFLTLPRVKREALAAVYAYCRLIDDIVDEPTGTAAEARADLERWTAEIENLYAGRPTHDISRALLGPVRQFALPKEEFLQMIRGCGMDLQGSRYETIADLESYMRGVASSVGVLCVHIFGWRHTPAERMRTFAETFGYAFQLTNIIRDVGADVRLGRVYLPLADLREESCDEETLRGAAAPPELKRVLTREYDRAKAYYARAREFVDPRDRRSLLPAEVMAHVYEGLLDEIKARDFPVLASRTRLSSGRKLALAVRAWLYCHGF
jgi:phytoene synthase